MKYVNLIHTFILTYIDEIPFSINTFFLLPFAITSSTSGYSSKTKQYFWGGQIFAYSTRNPKKTVRKKAPAFVRLQSTKFAWSIYTTLSTILPLNFFYWYFKEKTEKKLLPLHRKRTKTAEMSVAWGWGRWEWKTWLKAYNIRGPRVGLLWHLYFKFKRTNNNNNRTILLAEEKRQKIEAQPGGDEKVWVKK